MEAGDLDELARAIADHTIAESWPHWLALLALVFVGTGIGGYLGSYFAKRGEVQATRADRKEILDGLRQTTKAAEEVRSAISFNEWTERERRTLRRTKLEELLLLAYETKEWLAGELNRVYDTDEAKQASPQPKMMAIGSLYFPEIIEALSAYDGACDRYHGRILSAIVDVLSARDAHQANSAAGALAASQAMQAAGGGLNEGFRLTLQPLTDLDRAAAALMAEIITPTAPGA